MPERRHPSCRQGLPGAAARRPGAFTVVELVVVVAAVAILAVIAVPRYASALARYRVDLAAKRVAADLMLARSRARTTSARQIVDFSTRANGYTLTGMPSPDGRPGDYVVALADEPYKATVSNVSFGDPGVRAVWFNRYGTPESSGSVVVSAGGYQKTVALDTVTGKAVVR